MDQQNNAPLTPETKRNWFLKHDVLYSVIGILLLVVIVGTVYWWKEIKQTNQLQQNICIEGTKPEDCNDNIMVPVDDQSLKTYTNTEYGFEFNYPSSFEVSEKTRVFSLDKLDSNAKVTEEGPLGTSIGPIQIAIANSTALRNRVNEYYGFYSTSGEPSDGPGISCSEKEINNTLNITALDCRGENGGAIVAVIKLEKYDIWFHASEMQDREQIFDVISSFSLSNSITSDPLYFGKGSDNKYILVDLQSGQTKEFIPAGYKILDQFNYQMFPTFLILQKDNNLYSYSVEDKINNSIFQYNDLLLKSNEEARVFPSITEKDKFLFRIDTLDLSEVSEFDGSSPVLSTRNYSFDASTNKLVRIYPKNFGNHTRCVEYDSKNQRFFTWPCGEGIGSATPIYTSSLDGTNEKEIVNSIDLGVEHNDHGRVNYNSGLFFAQSDSGSKMIVLNPQTASPTKETYTISESIKSQITDRYPYSVSIDRSKSTLIVGSGSFILLLKYDNNKQIIQSKYIPDKEIYANFIFVNDGRLYYQAKDNIRVVNLGTWQVEKSVPSSGSFSEITLFK